MTPYQHTVQYYETDQMQISHHSNYIRWMEEARVAFLACIGFPYEKIEASGLISPVGKRPNVTTRPQRPLPTSSASP